METHVKSTIEIDGKRLGGFKDIRIAQSYYGHHTFEIIVPSDVIQGDDSNNMFQGKELIGKALTVDISPEENSKRSGQFNQFNGLITNVSILRHGINASDFVLRGYSPTILLDDGPNTRSFEMKTLSQVVKAVLKPYPKNDLRSKVEPKPDDNIDYVTQYNETNYNFLCRMAAFYGQWFYYDGTELRFGELGLDDERIELMMGQDLMEFELGLNVRPVKFNHTSYDYIKNEILDTTGSQINVTGMNELGKFAVTESEKLFGQTPLNNVKPYFADRSSLNTFSTNYKSGSVGDLVVAEGTSVNPKLRVGSRIKIKSAADQNTEDYGVYTITNVTHFTDLVGSYHNSFEAIPSTVSIPPMANNFNHPAADIQKAIVKENDDPENLGRIRVQFIWQKNPDMTPWIRSTTPHAGKNRGMQFIPEIDDEVLVCFEHNDPNRPVMMGALHQGLTKHEDRKDADNHIKTIRTISNNEIRFLDKPGEEEIIILNNDSENEIRLSLKDDKILIKAKNTIELIGKNILIEAEETLTMKSADMKAETSSSMKLESAGTSDSTSSGKMKIQAGAGLDIDGGPTTTVKASAKLDMSAGGQTVLKGGVVMIN